MSDAILQRITDIVRDILDNDSIILTPETTAEDVDGWDSLSNIQIIIAIEKAFKTRFKASEIRSWKDVGAMRDSVAKATGA